MKKAFDILIDPEKRLKWNYENPLVQIFQPPNPPTIFEFQKSDDSGVIDDIARKLDELFAASKSPAIPIPSESNFTSSLLTPQPVSEVEIQQTTNNDQVNLDDKFIDKSSIKINNISSTNINSSNDQVFNQKIDQQKSNELQKRISISSDQLQLNSINQQPLNDIELSSEEVNLVKSNPSIDQLTNNSIIDHSNQTFLNQPSLIPQQTIQNQPIKEINSISSIENNSNSKVNQTRQFPSSFLPASFNPQVQSQSQPQLTQIQQQSNDQFNMHQVEIFRTLLTKDPIQAIHYIQGMKSNPYYATCLILLQETIKRIQSLQKTEENLIVQTSTPQTIPTTKISSSKSLTNQVLNENQQNRMDTNVQSQQTNSIIDLENDRLLSASQVYEREQKIFLQQRSGAISDQSHQSTPSIPIESQQQSQPKSKSIEKDQDREKYIRLALISSLNSKIDQLVEQNEQFFQTNCTIDQLLETENDQLVLMIRKVEFILKIHQQNQQK